MSFDAYFLTRSLYVCVTCLTHVLDANTVLVLVKIKKPNTNQDRFIYLFCQNDRSIILAIHPTC